MRYVIIGGGIAGTTAAEELRKLDKTGEITLVSEEQHAIYSRVLLPHYIKEIIPRERVFLKKETWYAEQNIEWLRGELVVELDGKNKFVRLSSDREIEYDKLLIATGSAPRTVLDDPRGVSYLRSLDDAEHFIQLMKERETDWKAGIYGGGFIACEYLNLFAHAGIPTEIAFRGDHFWSNTLTDDAGELINRHLEKNGVTVHKQAQFKQILGDTQLEGFETSKGIHSCQILGVGIGIDPDIGFLKNTGIEMGRGILANEFLETNIPDIYTAGDGSEFYDVIAMRQVNTGNWLNSMTQGRVAAKNMFGEKTTFELVSSYAANALGLDIIFVGDTSKQHAETLEIIGSLEEGGITELFIRDNRLVGGVMIGRNQDRKEVTDAIRERRLFQRK